MVKTMVSGYDFSLNQSIELYDPMIHFSGSGQQLEVATTLPPDISNFPRIIRSVSMVYGRYNELVNGCKWWLYWFIYNPYIYIYTGWWFGTCFMTFHIFGIVTPTDELIFFRRVGIPSTRLLSFLGFVGLWDAYISTFLYVGFTHFFIFNTGDWRRMETRPSCSRVAQTPSGSNSLEI